MYQILSQTLLRQKHLLVLRPCLVMTASNLLYQQLAQVIQTLCRLLANERQNQRVSLVRLHLEHAGGIEASSLHREVPDFSAGDFVEQLDSIQVEGFEPT